MLAHGDVLNEGCNRRLIYLFSFSMMEKLLAQISGEASLQRPHLTIFLECSMFCGVSVFSVQNQN
jgi:hypothetical protein